MRKGWNWQRRLLTVMGGNTIGIQLPSANLLYLFDPSVGVYADAALTTPAVDGGSVRGLKDQGANALHLTQSGAAGLLPTYRASVAAFNNKPALEFDGGDYLTRVLSSPVLGNLSVYNVYCVYQTTNSSAQRGAWSESDPATFPFIESVVSYSGANAGKERFFHAGDGTLFSGPGLTGTIYNNGVAKLQTVRRSGAAVFSVRVNNWQDHADLSTTNPGTSTTTLFTLGGLLRAVFTEGFIGQIALLAAYSADNYQTIEPIIQNYFNMSPNYYPGSKQFFCIGDSKTGGWNDGVRSEYGGFGFPAVLGDNLTTATGDTWRELLPRAALNGGTTAAIKAAIDANLALVTGTPLAVLVNVGANDFPSMPTQAAFEANLGYILDACHTKWASASVFVMLPWRRTYGTQANTLAGYIANVLATRAAWASVGPDERVFLENGDDGATYTADGIHPNHAGYALTATEWQTAMGL